MSTDENGTPPTDPVPAADGGTGADPTTTAGGPQPSPARSPEDPLGLHEDVPAGTGQGDPLAGVRIDEDDAAGAVTPDS